MTPVVYSGNQNIPPVRPVPPSKPSTHPRFIDVTGSKVDVVEPVESSPHGLGNMFSQDEDEDKESVACVLGTYRPNAGDTSYYDECVQSGPHIRYWLKRRCPPGTEAKQVETNALPCDFSGASWGQSLERETDHSSEREEEENINGRYVTDPPHSHGRYGHENPGSYESYVTETPNSYESYETDIPKSYESYVTETTDSYESYVTETPDRYETETPGRYESYETEIPGRYEGYVTETPGSYESYVTDRSLTIDVSHSSSSQTSNHTSYRSETQDGNAVMNVSQNISSTVSHMNWTYSSDTANKSVDETKPHLLPSREPSVTSAPNLPQVPTLIPGYGHDSTMPLITPPKPTETTQPPESPPQPKEPQPTPASSSDNQPLQTTTVSPRTVEPPRFSTTPVNYLPHIDSSDLLEINDNSDDLLEEEGDMSNNDFTYEFDSSKDAIQKIRDSILSDTLGDLSGAENVDLDSLSLVSRRELNEPSVNGARSSLEFPLVFDMEDVVMWPGNVVVEGQKANPEETLKIPVQEFYENIQEWYLFF